MTEKTDLTNIPPAKEPVHQSQEQEGSISQESERLAEIVDTLKKGDTSCLEKLFDYPKEMIKSALRKRDMEIDGDGNIVSRDITVGDKSIVDSGNVSGNVFISVQKESPKLAARLAEFSSQVKTDISDLKKEISELRKRQTKHEERQRPGTQEFTATKRIYEPKEASKHGVTGRKSTRILSVTLSGKIVAFLTSLPNIDTDNGQRAFIRSASLDPDLYNLIRFNEPVAPFVQLLIPTLRNYGTLNDGRDALTVVLETAKEFVGQNRKEECDRLIEEYETFLQGLSQQPSENDTTVVEEEEPKIEAPPETLSRPAVQQNVKITGNGNITVGGNISAGHGSIIGSGNKVYKR